MSYFGPIEHFPDSISATDRDRLTAQYRAAIKDDAGAGLSNACVTSSATNTCRMPRRRGMDRAARRRGLVCVRRGGTHDRPHDAGRNSRARVSSEVARILGEMDDVRSEVGFKGDRAAFFDFLETDPQFYFTQRRRISWRVTWRSSTGSTRRCRSSSPCSPRPTYEVREVEPFRAASSAGGYYQPPSADGSRPGIFYVNTYNLKAQPKFGMETLSLHEAAPGHHFQIALQQELQDLPRFRRFGADYTAYVEGWALYAESLGKELGMFTDPYQWFGRLNDEQLRAMRLVVDTGLHAKGWTREQAIAYMLDNSTLAESDVVSEVERYIAWPGQALGYKIGDLRIQGLRHEAEQRTRREVRRA